MLNRNLPTLAASLFLEFIYDQLDNGRRFRIANILANGHGNTWWQLPQSRAASRERTALTDRSNMTTMIFSDNGSAFLQRQADLARRREIESHLIALRKAMH